RPYERSSASNKAGTRILLPVERTTSNSSTAVAGTAVGGAVREPPGAVVVTSTNCGFGAGREDGSAASRLSRHLHPASVGALTPGSLANPFGVGPLSASRRTRWTQTSRGSAFMRRVSTPAGQPGHHAIR